MNLLKIVLVFFVLSHFTFFSQNFPSKPKKKEIASPEFVSRIINSSIEDTCFLNIEMYSAQYDGARHNFPYFSISHPTTYDQKGIPKLLIKKTVIVNEVHSKVIKKYYQNYLRQEFDLEACESYCIKENLNLFRLIPFRVNNQNQIEELVDYEIVWNTEENPTARINQQSVNFKNASVLASGDWYKIAVTKTGLHKIDVPFLKKLGVPTNSIDPRQIQIFGNGGKMLPELNADFRYDDLEENAIQVLGESDGVMDDADYILFYASGTDEWKKTNASFGLKYEAVKSLYSDSSFYYITVGSGFGKRVTNLSSASLIPNINTDSYDYYNYHEEEKVNFGKTGRVFFGEYFDIQTTYGFYWNDGDFVTGDTIITKVSLAAAYTDTSQFLISGNGLQLNVTTASLNVGSYLADYARVAVKTGTALNNASETIGISISKLTSKSVGWLDKLTVNARRRIRINNKQFQFRDSRVVGPGKICQYFINKVQTATPLLWNVTDPLQPFIQGFTSSGNTIDFIATSNALNEYCIVHESDLYTPIRLGKIENQNLHNIQQADYVIITHPLFLSQAERLATFHQNTEGYTTAVVTIDQVYNEFSSGKQDISAIRDFIRMLYSRNITANKQVKYALLIGDGSYINRVRSTLNNSNFIPTYQTLESLSATSSIATDDFYGLMDVNEGNNAESKGVIDVGIGRFTCRTLEEVKGVVNKIENYYRKDPSFNVSSNDPQNCSTSGESPMGDWRNNLLFMADDGDEATHMKGADNLSNLVKNISFNYNADKIYLDAYQRLSTSGGQRYPDAEEDYKRRIKKGVLLFNYTGHGGEVGLTAERVLDIPTINAMDNFNKLPLFITATCEFSRYDDPGRTSAGEMCLTNSKGAAIALLTTCRLAYSSTNDLLNGIVMDKLFSRLPSGKRPTLGDVIRLTKSSSLLGGQSFYYANFHLLGDPAMPLVYPEYKVITSKINNIPYLKGSFDLGDSTLTDSLSFGALSKITVSGFIADTLGNKLNNFNGVVYSSVFDKVEEVVCLLNDPGSYTGFPGNPFRFKLQKNTLFKGKSKVTNGDFSFTFIIPKDISFALGPGKISYYATNGIEDANGAFGQLNIGGGSNNAVIDNEGPKIDFYLNDKNFVNGSVTNEKPVLYADVTDSSGINTLGTSFGHDITAILNKSGSKPIILNDYYEASLNSYQSGRVRYPFEELPEGDYQLTFKVWDIQNNSSTSNNEFVVAQSAELALNHVLNYPNPFTTHTKFFFEHNQACAPLKVTVQIYTISGKVVKTIRESMSCEGFRADGIDWDGKDDYGDKLARGVYIYRLSIINPENKKAEKIEKLVILN